MSNGHSVIARGFMIALCRAQSWMHHDSQMHSHHICHMWLVPHMHFLVWLMIGSCGLHCMICMSSVCDSLFSRSKDLLLGRLCGMMLASGLFNKLSIVRVREW